MENKFVRVIDYPFRIFFLSAGCWAVLVIPLWVLGVTGVMSLPTALPLLSWHQHEMLFGFLNPAIAGFLLTAVCVWTGTDRTHGTPLLLLWLLWLCGRLVMLFDLGLPPVLVVAINLLFLPMVILDAGRRVWRVRQRRQYVLLGALAMVWAAECGLLLFPMTGFDRSAMIIVFAVMAVIGGRITPGFSAGWLRQRGGNADAVYSSTVLDLFALITTLALGVLLLTPWDLVILISAIACGLLHLVRIVLWRGWLVRSEPLLWILHLALLWIPISLFMLALGVAGWIPANLWIHGGGIGAIATLILGVMSRVSLGHTGRPLVLPRGMVTAFVLIQVCVLVRVVTGLGAVDWQLGISVTAVLWVIPFALFVWRYASVLTSARADGKPG